MNKYLFYVLLLLNSTMIHAEVVFKDTFGKTTAFSSLQGKWVLLNYWAPWCDTCIAEIPELNHFYEKHKKDPVVLYGVNYDDMSSNEQGALNRQYHIKYPTLLNDPARKLRLGYITGVPVTFVFNPKGKLVKRLYGGQTAQSLEEAIGK